MTNIVILGAGYGGILTALGLSKKFGRSKEFLITLIDRHDYQLFASNLYEVASAEEEMTTLSQLKHSIALPLEAIFTGRNVNLVKAEVLQINPVSNSVFTGSKKYYYDYLVVAVGSTSDYFNIPGAEKFSLPLKSLNDAFFVRNKIEFAVQMHRLDANKKNIRIVVAGGGFTGVEFAGELKGFLDILAWKNRYPREKIEVTIIEASSALIAGFSARLSRDVLDRLKALGVRVQFSSMIAKVDEHFVELASGEKMEYDVLVWTAGVKALSLPFTKQMETDKKGRLVTNEFLQLNTYNNIFALGDGACVANYDGKPAPPSAQDAIAQAEYLVNTLPYIIRNKRPPAYSGKKHGYIISIGGKWAILDYNGFYFTGLPAYLVRQLANLNYFRKVVGLWKAIKLTVFDMEIYSRND